MNNTMLGPKASLSLKALLQVQRDAKLELTGEVTQGGRYKYGKVSDILRAVLSIVLENNCILLANEEVADVDSSFHKLQGAKDTTPKDKLVTFSNCLVSVRIQSVDDPDDYVISQSFGFKADYNDKASGAGTIAWRYALLHLCALPPDGSEDPEESTPVNNSLFAEPKDKSTSKAGGLFQKEPEVQQEVRQVPGEFAKPVITAASLFG